MTENEFDKIKLKVFKLVFKLKNNPHQKSENWGTILKQSREYVKIKSFKFTLLDRVEQEYLNN